MDRDELKVKRHAASIARMSKRGEIGKLANSFDNSASRSLTAMGKLVAYTPEQLQELVSSKEARLQGAPMRVEQLRKRAQELLVLLNTLQPSQDADTPALMPSQDDDERPLELFN